MLIVSIQKGQYTEHWKEFHADGSVRIQQVALYDRYCNIDAGDEPQQQKETWDTQGFAGVCLLFLVTQSAQLKFFIGYFFWPWHGHPFIEKLWFKKSQGGIAFSRSLSHCPLRAVSLFAFPL